MKVERTRPIQRIKCKRDWWIKENQHSYRILIIKRTQHIIEIWTQQPQQAIAAPPQFEICFVVVVVGDPFTCWTKLVQTN